MSEDVLLKETNEGVTVLTLNRPNQMNALSNPLKEALDRALSDLADDPATDVVILTGAGKAFCAGLDLKELGTPGHKAHPLEVFKLIHALPQPVIGAINGVAITGGFEIATACDFLIGTPNTRFADTHARVGIIPGWGLSQRLPRIIGLNRAKEYSLTGNFISAEQAEAWGLLNKIVAPEALLSTALELAQAIRSCDPETMRKYKRLIDDGFDLPLGEAMELEKRMNRSHTRASPEEMERRRLAVTERGREQTGG